MVMTVIPHPNEEVLDAPDWKSPGMSKGQLRSWRRGEPQAFLSTVANKSPATQEADQCKSALASQLDRQIGGRGDRGQQWNSGYQRFLNDLEAPSATRQQRTVR